MGYWIKMLTPFDKIILKILYVNITGINYALFLKAEKRKKYKYTFMKCMKGIFFRFLHTLKQNVRVRVNVNFISELHLYFYYVARQSFNRFQIILSGLIN